MNNIKIFCIIPAFNEEKTIVEVINQVKQFVSKVVIIDDGSTDKTFKLAQAEGVIVLRHIINRGQGAALETGNQYAFAHSADIVVHFDADGQFTAEEISDMIKPIKKGEADIVFGSRFLEKKSAIPSLKKNIILPLARLVNKIFIKADLTDPQNGFRALSVQAAKMIKIEQDNMAHCSEIIAKAFAGNFRIKEVPVTVVYHNFGQRLTDGLKILKDLFLSRLIH